MQLSAQAQSQGQAGDRPIHCSEKFVVLAPASPRHTNANNTATQHLHPPGGTQLLSPLTVLYRISNARSCRLYVNTDARGVGKIKAVLAVPYDHHSG
jgi:hypothetical protein